MSRAHLIRNRSIKVPPRSLRRKGIGRADSWPLSLSPSHSHSPVRYVSSEYQTDELTDVLHRTHQRELPSISVAGEVPLRARTKQKLEDMSLPAISISRDKKRRRLIEPYLVEYRVLVRVVNPGIAVADRVRERRFRARALVIVPHHVTLAIRPLRRGSVHPRLFERRVVRLLALRH